MTFEVLDPTYGDGADAFEPAPRLDSVRGRTLGVISNGKQGTGRFFDALAEHLQSHHGVARVERLTKGNYSAPAGDDIIDKATKWAALIAGVGD